MSFTRREFLQSMLSAGSVLSLAPALPGFLQRAALAAPGAPSAAGNVLVVLQLSGGNDGLNTIVPYADDAYGRARKTLRLTDREVIKIDDYQGFHPRLSGLHRLFADGELTVVHGVGYPKNNRDHEAAMKEWHTARPADASYPTGWIGRAVDLASRGEPATVPAAFVGPIAQPFALQAAESVVPTLREARDWKPAQVMKDPAVSSATGTDNPLLEAVRQSAEAGRAMGQRVEKVLAGSASSAEYPSYTLAGQLREVSRLIQAELGIRIFFVELGGGGIGGFDNHANQRDNHASLLWEMSESINAFAADLRRQNLLDRVMLMTFSEFGRTVTENGRRGTDHGAAAPLLLVGGSLRGGLLGEQPSLTDLEQDAQRHHTDFRQVYTTVLQQWLDYDAEAILGGKYDVLDV